MSERVGCAMCGPDRRVSGARREVLPGPDVPGGRSRLDRGLTGTTCTWLALARVSASVRVDDIPVVAKAARLARPVTAAGDIGDPLAARRQTRLVPQHRSGERTLADPAELVPAGRATVHRVLERHRTSPAAPSTPVGR
ncbi:hypothetical protein [Streptomyces sp. NPDC001380]|uniref:hypothetical protein n=1 Tax=Streptomyces sp. NPDC001380 TaxID=3364566 RepID=UPI0036D0D32A